MPDTPIYLSQLECRHHARYVGTTSDRTVPTPEDVERLGLEPAGYAALVRASIKDARGEASPKP